ncbi:ArsC/Spx/MgsR family protein [Magnetofaba australis]|uniref:Putative nitrogenase-associated protein n=1 Tax=Magnetofaba australis IT-1 TaxID=1434232 RepID=A0A1Y2K2G1_9PROT|nr:ArsC/Spx/MgsR family protein [Magnetofaba australis]OSM02220.1 putative nitrogenase-associated protein [Magnetofaba australis IT-1]
MATVIFYEKPGCINNTLQKSMLEASGHTVDARSLLTAAWTPDALRPFFGELPVDQWFNRSAPQVKSGAVIPERMSAAQALDAMCAEPLLIRRPLMQVDADKRCGFHPLDVDAWIGLTKTEQTNADVESCPKTHDAAPCPTPAGA